MKLTNKKILVTGACGFIGSHLTEKLVQLGYNVRAFVFYNSFNSWGWLDYSPMEIRKNIEVFAGDVRDPHGIERAMKGCNIVFHLAALISIPYSYHSPDTYIDTNIKGTLNVMEAAKELAIDKVIHTSTSEVYGTAQYVPIDEKHPLRGQSPYSASKIGADQIAMSYYLSFGTPVAIIRPFNTYGPRQSARAVIPTIIAQIARAEDRIKLGSLYPTRDFSYVKDVVRGFIAVAESDHSVGEVINIGSNYEISIKDTVNLLTELMGVDIRIETDKQRIRPENSEVERLWADISKAKKLTGWAPEYGGLEGFKRGLKATCEWFNNSDNMKLYKSGLYNF